MPQAKGDAQKPNQWIFFILQNQTKISYLKRLPPFFIGRHCCRVMRQAVLILVQLHCVKTRLMIGIQAEIVQGAGMVRTGRLSMLQCLVVPPYLLLMKPKQPAS
ncbi:MAG: hypothetical protein OI74_15555 [Gammaproteobacteria bacterium (ex Lamellibrachia satsuma)]|nr:MAG: hypothetical protein OI74_15555 [Gammaproteobacteria bacterium (ex Lamellibrachia satsuma)]RRS34170.1 MAG: hypothetical protein NV67_14310 [Gammaproteobacteria bacterium (ex Lamellibrachia satsuma)]